MKSTYSTSSTIRELETDFAAIERKGFDMIDTKFNDGVWFTAYKIPSELLRNKLYLILFLAKQHKR